MTRLHHDMTQANRLFLTQYSDLHFIDSLPLPRPYITTVCLLLHPIQSFYVRQGLSM
jgi:hypothetical protein